MGDTVNNRGFWQVICAKESKFGGLRSDFPAILGQSVQERGFMAEKKGSNGNLATLTKSYAKAGKSTMKLLSAREAKHAEGRVARMIEGQTVKIPSNVFLWAAVASIRSGDDRPPREESICWSVGRSFSAVRSLQQAGQGSRVGAAFIPAFVAVHGGDHRRSQKQRKSRK